MDELNEAANGLFLLALFLIAVAYFTGFASDVNSVSTAATSLIQVATGRNSNGQFSNYPKAA